MGSRVRIATKIAQPNIVASFSQCERQITIIAVIYVASNAVHHKAGARVWKAMLKQDGWFVWRAVIGIHLSVEKFVSTIKLISKRPISIELQLTTRCNSRM